MGQVSLAQDFFKNCSASPPILNPPANDTPWHMLGTYHAIHDWGTGSMVEKPVLGNEALIVNSSPYSTSTEKHI